MSKLNTAELNAALRNARQVVPLGTHYRHKKGGLYRVTGHAFDTHLAEPTVRYRRVGGPEFDPFQEADIEFTRPLAEWTEDRFEEIAG